LGVDYIKMGRKLGKKYPEKVSFLLTTEMRGDIMEIGMAKGFVVEVDAIRYLLKKGIKYHKKKYFITEEEKIKCTNKTVMTVT